MELFVGLLVLLAGVVLVLAGVKSRAPQLFATVTGVGTSTDPAAGGKPAAYLAGGPASGPAAGTTGVHYA